MIKYTSIALFMLVFVLSCKEAAVLEELSSKEKIIKIENEFLEIKSVVLKNYRSEIVSYSLKGIENIFNFVDSNRNFAGRFDTLMKPSRTSDFRYEFRSNTGFTYSIAAFNEGARILYLNGSFDAKNKLHLLSQFTHQIRHALEDTASRERMSKDEYVNHLNFIYSETTRPKKIITDELRAVILEIDILNLYTNDDFRKGIVSNREVEYFIKLFNTSSNKLEVELLKNTIELAKAYYRPENMSSDDSHPILVNFLAHSLFNDNGKDVYFYNQIGGYYEPFRNFSLDSARYQIVK